MYLVDTNVFLEALLEQEQVDTVKQLFQEVDFNLMYVSDLSLHSIGIILFGLGKHDLFVEFLDDMIVDGIEILSVKITDLKALNEIAQNFQLDFDDAYQYQLANQNDLKLISFDRDFDKTERGRKAPAEVLASPQH